MPSPSLSPFARVSSAPDAIRRRNEQLQAFERAASVVTKRILVGVCAMDKKALSKPMKAILKRMNAAEEFEIITFGDEMILNRPVEDWPKCEVLLAWHSQGFPLKKAQQYVALRRPKLINDVNYQDLLLDRRHVYRVLQDHNVPTPPHVVVSRTPEQAAAGIDPEGFEETADYVAMDGVKMSKPFVEKPSCGDNHNVWIYYPDSMGGGVKMMFRKVGDKSAAYDPGHPGTVRRDGSYIYEEFIATGGTDVKVYTVGTEYAHAEARKSPVVDGKVQRTPDGKEIRFPVLLTPQEKDIASVVVKAFKQKICGFDLLRTDDATAYVCDVNGWSFVKNSKKYYDDAAGILRDSIFCAMGSSASAARRALPQVTHDDELPEVLEFATPGHELEELDKEKVQLRHLQAEIDHTNKTAENAELLCVLAVIRHGDRTPKQKLKLTVSHAPFMAVFDKFKDAKGRQAKLKAPAELQAFLAAVVEVSNDLKAPSRRSVDLCLDPTRAAAATTEQAAPPIVLPPDTQDESSSEFAQFNIIKTVLQQGLFMGINRKVQLKPTAVDDSTGNVTQLQVIVKWGGVLTHLGRRQAEQLGNTYRMVMYPQSSDGGGLLRLHSTYRHDLKIYSSDEGRVQTSAAAFAKGLLDLEGESLTPILVSLVKKDAAMLDAFGKGASEDIKAAKEVLYRNLTRNPDNGESLCFNASTQKPLPTSPNLSMTSLGETASTSDEPVVPCMPDQPLADLHELHEAINELLSQLWQKMQGPVDAMEGQGQFSALNTNAYTQENLAVPYGAETLLMMYARWHKLEKALYKADGEDGACGVFDCSQIPDVYDSIKFDLIHNSHLNCNYSRIFPVAKRLADCVVPAEYGITPSNKLRIGKKIASELIGKLLVDMENSKHDCEAAPPGAAVSIRPTPAPSASSAAHSGADDGASTQEGENEDPRVHILAPFTQNVNSIKRHVRTRIYFTSESHIHSLMAILRHSELQGRSLLSEEGKAKLESTREFDYLTQLVFRLYEIKQSSPDNPPQFQVEIQFSNGCNSDPRETKVMDDTPRENIHRGHGVSFAELQEHLGEFTQRATEATAAHSSVTGVPT